MNEPVFSRSAEALVAEIGDDVVALSVDRGLTYGMTGVTADVWRLLERPRSLTELCGELLASYEVSAETCREEVLLLLEQMVAEGLLDRMNGQARP